MEPATTECEFLKGFTFLRLLGRGWLGKVFLAERSNQTYAIKAQAAAANIRFEGEIHRALEAARRKYPHYMRNVVRFQGGTICTLDLWRTVWPVPRPEDLTPDPATGVPYEIMVFNVYQALTDILQNSWFYTTLSEQYRFFVCSMQQVICQMLYLKKMFVKLDHNDLHYGNMMMAPHDEDIEYLLPARGGAALLVIPIAWAQNRLIKIGDFGRAHLRVQTPGGVEDIRDTQREDKANRLADELSVMMYEWGWVIQDYCKRTPGLEGKTPRFIDTKEYYHAADAIGMLPNYSGMLSRWTQFLMEEPFFANVVAPRPPAAPMRLEALEVVVDYDELYSTVDVYPISSAIDRAAPVAQMLVCANCAASTPVDSWRAAPYLIATRRGQTESVVLCGAARCRHSINQ
jgi:hypothetical protein